MVKLRQGSFCALRRTALVTGASRGVGKGIAVILAKRVSRFSARAGRLAMRICRIALFGFPATTPATMKLPPCLQKVAAEAEGLGLLVNSAWGGYEGMTENGTFTWTCRSGNSRLTAGPA